MKTLHRHYGSILIEALISLVVLAFGIAAIAKLQGTYIKGGAEAEARNIALQLAQQRIDDLRAYNELTWPASILRPIRPYSEIQDNMGGSIAWTTTQVGNTAYNIGWTVDNYQVPDDETLPLVLLADNNTDGSSYKKITVTANWTPPCDKTVTDPCPSENVNLTTYITKLDHYGETLMGGGGYSTGGPKVQYNPGLAPDVIAIDTSGESIETTLPEPAIKKIASENYFYSQFETVTYNIGGDALRNEEFLNINCECEYDSPDYIDKGFPVARSIWHPRHDGTLADKALHDEYVNDFFHPDINDHAFISQTESGRADFLGEQFTKVIGQSPAGDSAQHPFCNICCRDHHDAKASFITTNNDGDDKLAGAYACNPGTDFAAAGNTNGDRARCFDPWRPATDYDPDTGDHKHYTGTGVEVAPGGTGVYLESCRLKRINGEFSVFQDWHLHGSTFVAAPRKAFTPGETDNVVSAYQAYIKEYVSAVIENADNLPVTSINNPATAYVWPVTSATYPVTASFISRGIYMDYLDSFTLEQLNEVRDSTDPDIAAKFFENAPFNEINLTRLTDWHPQCVNNTSKGDVSNTASGFVSDGPDTGNDPDPGSCVTNYGINLALDVANINRGLVLAIDNAPFTLSATMHLSNTGIVGTNSPLVENLPSVLYPTANDRSYDTTSARFNYQIAGSTTPSTPTCTAIVKGIITKGTKNVNDKDVKINSSPGGICDTPKGNVSSGEYTCPVGPQPDGQGLFIFGDFVTGDETVTVDCDSAVNGIVTITGPSFTTTDTI